MKKQFIFEGSPGSPPLESTTRSANLLDHEELMARMASFDLAKHSIRGVSSNWITMENQSSTSRASHTAQVKIWVPKKWEASMLSGKSLKVTSESCLFSVFSERTLQFLISDHQQQIDTHRFQSNQRTQWGCLVGIRRHLSPDSSTIFAPHSVAKWCTGACTFWKLEF